MFMQLSKIMQTFVFVGVHTHKYCANV